MRPLHVIAMQGMIARIKLATNPPDIVVEIPRNLCRTLEFDRADEVIEYGYNLCSEVFEKRAKERLRS